MDVTSGTAPYTYSWTNEGGDVVSTDAAASDLADGVYTVRVTDANGCTNTCLETIANTPAVEITCSAVNGSCGGLGSASVSVTSGTGPYSYAWSNGATSASIDNLAPGNYSVTVTDANGCSASCSTSVGSTAPPLVDIACGSDPLLEVGGSNSVANATGCGSLDYAFWSNTLLDAYGVDNHWSVDRWKLY